MTVMQTNRTPSAMYLDERAASAIGTVVACIVALLGIVLFWGVVCSVRVTNILGDIVHRQAVANKETKRNMKSNRQAHRERQDLKQSHDVRLNLMLFCLCFFSSLSETKEMNHKYTLCST